MSDPTDADAAAGTLPRAPRAPHRSPGLRTRLVIALGVAAAASSLLVAWAAYASAADRLHSDLDREVAGQAIALGAELNRTGIADVRVPFDPRPSTRLRTPGLGRGARRPGSQLAARFGAVQLLDANGTIVDSINLVASQALPVDDTDRRLAVGGDASQTPSPPDPSLGSVRVRGTELAGTPIRIATVGLRNGGAVQTAIDAGPVRNSLRALGLRYAAIGFVATVMAMAGGWLVARRLARPIEALAAATSLAATTGDLDAPINAARGLTGDDEVGRLAGSFSTLLGALSASRDTQRRLVQDAGHELRTPLTSVRTNIEVLRRHADLDPEVRAQVLADIESEVKELSALVDELVQLAAGDLSLTVAPGDVDLAELVQGQVERAVRRSGRTIIIEGLEPTTILASASSIERAVANLIDNALKFSEETSPVEVRLAGGDVVVADHGPGIAPGERIAVFERFNRAASARAVPGSGLGLAIVEQVAASHGGRAWITDRRDATPGAEVHLRIVGIARLGP